MVGIRKFSPIGSVCLSTLASCVQGAAAVKIFGARRNNRELNKTEKKIMTFSSSEEDEIVTKAKKKKVKTFASSSSENEDEEIKSRTEKRTAVDEGQKDEVGSLSSQSSKGQNTKAKVDSSDDEDELRSLSPVSSPPNNKGQKMSGNIKKLLDESSSDEGVDDPNPVQRQISSGSDSDAAQLSSVKDKNGRKKKVDSSDEEDELRSLSPCSSPNNKGQTTSINKKKLLDDSSSSDEGVNDPNPVQRQISSGSESEATDFSAVRDKKGRKKDKKRQLSKKTAMAEIRSESARMLRETAISLPYHQPKQRSLREFLQRKRNKPELPLGGAMRINANDKKDLEELEKAQKAREKLAQEYFEEQEDDGDGDDEDDEDYIPELQSGNFDRDHGQNQCRSEVEPRDPQDGSEQVVQHRENDDKGPVDGRQEEEVVENKEKVEVNDEGKIDQESEVPQSESLHLMLEADSEEVLSTTASGSVVLSSQKQINDITVDEKLGGLTVKKLASLGARFDMNAKPTLSSTSDTIILEEDEGQKALFQKAVKHAKAGKKTSTMEDVTISIVRKDVDADGNERLRTEEIAYHSKANKDKAESGMRHLQLKNKLREEINARKREERRKKEQMRKFEENEEFGPTEEDMEVYEEENDYDDDDEEEEEEDDEESEEEEIVFKDKPRKKSEFVDDEAEDDEGVDEEGGMDHLTLEESDEENETLPSFLQETQKTESQQQPAKKKLFGGLLDKSDVGVESMDELVGLCSGRFKTQAALNDEVRDEDDENDADTQILTENQCSADTVIMTGNEVEDAPGFMEDHIGSTLPFESDEDEDIESVKKKAKRPLVMSDDEEEEEEKEKTSNFKGFLGKKGGLRREYVENEAELSGDEPESGDEDERGLDRLDEEEGDLEDFDEENVRDEVGQIHQKRILDEDKREVRLFQEAFLEDGELHTDRARTRQFRWHGIDAQTELDKRFSDGEDNDEAENADEEKRRMAKLEREKWVQESSSKVTLEEDDSQFFNMASKALKKMDGKKNSVNRKEESSKLPFQSLLNNKSSSNSVQRGSFLSRDEKILDRLAEITKGTENQKTGTGAKNTNNFVFAALSPDKKASGAGEPNNERKRGARKPPANAKIPAKKPKINRTIDENSRDTIFGLM